MNRTELERKLLLEATGELPADERDAVATWLRAHHEDATWWAATLRLLDASREALPAGTPGVAVRANLRAAAAARRTAPPALVFPAVWLRGLAYAAALALAVAGWLWMNPQGGGDRVAEIHAILAVTRTTSGSDASAATSASVDSDEGKLRALARDLLQMEGFTLEEDSSDNDAAWDEVIPAAEPLPTVLRPRNTGAPAARTYG